MTMSLSSLYMTTVTYVVVLTSSASDMSLTSSSSRLLTIVSAPNPVPRSRYPTGPTPTASRASLIEAVSVKSSSGVSARSCWPSGQAGSGGERGRPWARVERTGGGRDSGDVGGARQRYDVATSSPCEDMML